MDPRETLSHRVSECFDGDDKPQQWLPGTRIPEELCRASAAEVPPEGEVVHVIIVVNPGTSLPISKLRVPSS